MEGSSKKDLGKPAPVKSGWRIEQWFPELDKSKHVMLKTYQDELLRFNRTLSLVSNSTVDKIDLVHVADSILGWQTIKKNFSGTDLYDIGSGNGCPGLIIAILEPQLKLHLVESDIRKSEFLKHTADACGLKSVTVLNMRMDALDAGSINTGVLRGFAGIPKTLLSIRKFMSAKGRIYHFKGPEWSTELAALPQQLCSTWNNEHIGDYSLPEGQIKHTIIRSERI